MSLLSSFENAVGESSPITNLTPIDFSSFECSEADLFNLNQKLKYRFFQIKEIPEAKSSQYRLAMANVLSGVQHTKQSIVYLLSGTSKGIELYIGVASHNENFDIHDAAESLKNSLFEIVRSNRAVKIAFDNIKIDSI